jgi:predicted transcriptional regulator
MNASDDTLTVPHDLQEQVRAAAEEQRAPDQLVGEAIERYLWERRWLREDEIHAKIARGLESLEQGRGLDGESVMAELVADLERAEPPSAS